MWRQKCLLFGEFRMLAPGTRSHFKGSVFTPDASLDSAAVGGLSPAQFSCLVNSTGLCLPIPVHSETSLSPVGLLMLRGRCGLQLEGLGSLPAVPSLFPFGVCLGFVHDSHPSTSRRSTAEGKRLSQFSRCRLHWETCLHGNRRVTSPNSIHRSIFFF